MQAHDPFKATKPASRNKVVRRSPIHIEDLEVCNDPVPKKRDLGPGRYDSLFSTLQPGQCIKCEPEHAGAIGNALRNWLKRKKKKSLAVKSVRVYAPCKDKLGRVWLINADDKVGAK